MVKFDSLPRNQVVLVECRAFASNIVHDITSRLGLVHFEVYLQVSLFFIIIQGSILGD